MNNVSFVTKIDPNGVEIEHAIIDRGDGEYTSMLKSTYDEMIAAQSTPSLQLMVVSLYGADTTRRYKG